MICDPCFDTFIIYNILSLKPSVWENLPELAILIVVRYLSGQVGW